MVICPGFLRAGQMAKQCLAYLPRHILPQTMLVSCKTTTYLVAQKKQNSIQYFCPSMGKMNYDIKLF
jgi:hypothetical protein